MELFKYLIVIFFLALATTSWPVQADSDFTSFINFHQGPLEVTFINYEQPRSKPFIIAHFKVFNPTKAELTCNWQEFCTLASQTGKSINTNYDAMVDMGNGMVRTSGPFSLAPGRKATVSVLFVLGPHDLPGRIVLANERKSILIYERDKVRYY